MLFILLEEASMEPVIKIVISQLQSLNNISIEYSIKTHQGKQDLENSLGKTIPALTKQPNASILIIRDKDSGDCIQIKQNIENIIKSKITVPYKIRIACHELENWFLGDLEAIEFAFSRFNKNKIVGKKEYSNVDEIVNPIDRLLKIIPDYKGIRHISKVSNAEKISQYMVISKNKSTSFQHTVLAIKELQNIR